MTACLHVFNEDVREHKVMCKMDRQNRAGLVALIWLGTAVLNLPCQETYRVKASHPRLLIEEVREMARRCDGPLADDYRVVKQRADAAVRRGGMEYISNPWSIPEDLMNCGLACLVERERGGRLSKICRGRRQAVGGRRADRESERQPFRLPRFGLRLDL
jgi:hypothetical protein